MSKLQSTRYRRKGRAMPMVAASLALALLAGCGYQLRSAPPLPPALASLDLSCDIKKNWRLCQQVRQVLKASNVKLDANAPYRLEVSLQESKNRVLTLRTDDASAAEYELTRIAFFRLSDRAQNKQIAEDTRSRRRIFRHDDTALLAREREEQEVQDVLDQQLAVAVVEALSIYDADRIAQILSEN